MRRHTCTQEYLPVKQWQLLLLTLLLQRLLLSRTQETNILLPAMPQNRTSSFTDRVDSAESLPFPGVVYLSWSSLQESNSSHFDVQRSADGITFYSTGKVRAQSVSDKVVSYNFQGCERGDGMNYYRVQY